MARFSRLTVLNTTIETGLVPVFYNADVDVATRVVKACADGEAKVVEFTNRGDLAPEVFKQLLQFASRKFQISSCRAIAFIHFRTLVLKTGQKRGLNGTRLIKKLQVWSLNGRRFYKDDWPSGISRGRATYRGTPIRQTGDNPRGQGTNAGIELRLAGCRSSAA